MTILANLQNIHLAFGNKVLFHDAKLTIHKGDQIGLIGLNGKGKSTLFKILTEQVVPDISTPAFLYQKNKELTIFLVPQELPIQQFQELSIRTFYLAFHPTLYSLHQRLKQIEQKITAGDLSESVLKQQATLLEEFETLGGHRIASAYESYLKLFELFDREQKLTELSGGEQKKMALSAGLSCPEQMVLWDEPTNHLDIETIEKLEDELKKSSKTNIIISHDRYLLGHVTNKICHIHDGVIEQFDGTYLDYLGHLEEKEKERLKQLDRLSNMHRRELEWMRQGIKARGTRSKKRVEGFHNLTGAISELKGSAKKVVNMDLHHTGRKTKRLVEISDGSFSYSKGPLLQQLNLSIYKKDKIALIGPNGAGKSTLINIIAGNLSLSSGTFYSADNLEVGIFDQKRQSLDESKTPKQLLSDKADYVILPDGSQRHIHSYLESYLFTDDQINRPISSLSGGEKNRLQLALFMKEAADLWIFDEPTNDLDIETIELLEQQLKNYEQAVIIIGHDRAFLDNVVDTTWLVNENTIEIFTGGYSQVAPYLHAIEMEKELSQLSQPSNQNEAIKQPLPQTKKERMNNKEKMRWKVIEDEIMNAEMEKEELETKLHSFDFGDMSEQTRNSYNQLNEKAAELAKELEALYHEWETLSNKEP